MSAEDKASQDNPAKPIPAAPEADQPPVAGNGKGPDATSKPAAQPSTAERELHVEETVPDCPEPQLTDRIKNLFVGKPRDLADKTVFQHVSLIAFLAWVGLGADGLSSSCYGPPEAFSHLITTAGDFTFLAVFLALATIVTVFVISACYSYIIEEFPTGGGGYLVASKLLGPRFGVVSGSALLVDYILTVTVSIAAAGDAVFGLTPERYLHLKLPLEFAVLVFLIVLNLRGVKETIKVLMPIFLVFLFMHAILIAGTFGMRGTEIGGLVTDISEGVKNGLNNADVGFWGMAALFLRAYSLGAGTYTGIEAVSNSMPMMREPRVATAKRTMMYMAFSLAITAGGLMVAYLLFGLRHPSEGKTMNFLLTEEFVKDTFLHDTWGGTVFVWVMMMSEAALLFVAAQAGFIGGPRLLAYLAQDSWAPHWFANLSERLATHNGIIVMGVSAIAALWYTDGNVATLVIMYSINVFLTFSLSMVGMCKYWYHLRGKNPLWVRRLSLFAVGAVFCIAILGITIFEKFDQGAWKTLLVTGVCIGAFYGTRMYYDGVNKRLRVLDETLGAITPPNRPPNRRAPDPGQPTAAILVGGYSGLGIHTMLNAVKFAPGYFKNLVFVSVGVVDSGNFKGVEAVEDLKDYTEETLKQYVGLAQKLGMASTSYMSIGTDPVDELERVCLAVKKEFPQATFFAGRLMFRRDGWYQRFLHNQTAYLLQHRLQWDGIPMVILPTRVR